MEAREEMQARSIPGLRREGEKKAVFSALLCKQSRHILRRLLKAAFPLTGSRNNVI
jgi:hypothetical protein